MKIKEIFPHLRLEGKISRQEPRGISEDSRFLRSGDLFFVRARRNFDIFSALSAVKKNAVAFVGEAKNENKLRAAVGEKPLIVVRRINKEFYRAVDKFYGFNKNDFKFIGITGTNGKTTTASLIHYLLNKMGEKASLVGTVKYFIGDKTYTAQYTTPGYLSLRKIFQKMKMAGSRFAVIEASSHGIEQERIKGIGFSRCVFTNLSRDHLDYHRTMHNYFDAKKKLFREQRGALAIINVDDYYGRKLCREVRRFFSYGIKRQSNFRAENIRILEDGMGFTLVYNRCRLPVKAKIFGRHNVLNILAALATLSSLGFPLKKIIAAVPHFPGVEGRLEEVCPDTFIDYAHTPDALKRALSSLKEIGYKKIVCVFGCGGERDRGKREIMGKIASRYATFSFITSDNPRGEDPLKICAEIRKGFRRRNYSLRPDRKKAIGEALKSLRADNFTMSRKKNTKERMTCVLVAGKGHENYQITGNKKIPFKDSTIVKKLIVSRR